MIDRLPSEASCLLLVWTVLDWASAGWPGLRYTAAIARHLTEIRHQLHRPPNEHYINTTNRTDTVTTAA